MSRNRSFPIRTPHTTHSAPIPKSTLQNRRETTYTKQQAELAQALFSKPKPQATPNAKTLQNGAGDVFSFYSENSDTLRAGTHNAIEDCKEFNVTESSQGCADPSYTIYDSGNGQCDQEDTDDAAATRPKTQNFLPGQNSQLSVNTCGNSATPSYEATRVCLAGSAAATCATPPSPPLTVGDKIGLGVGVGAPIGGTLLLCFLYASGCCAATKRCCQSRSDRAASTALLPHARAAAAAAPAPAP